MSHRRDEIVCLPLRLQRFDEALSVLWVDIEVARDVSDVLAHGVAVVKAQHVGAGVIDPQYASANAGLEDADTGDSEQRAEYLAIPIRSGVAAHSHCPNASKASRSPDRSFQKVQQ